MEDGMLPLMALTFILITCGRVVGRLYGQQLDERGEDERARRNFK